MDISDKNSNLLVDSMTKMTISDNRPTFYHNNDLKKPVRAGGVLFFKKVNEKVYYLLIFNPWEKCKWFEDIGGKTDMVDLKIEDTISRETHEETNNLIEVNLTNKLLENKESHYIENSKYTLYLVEAPEEIKKLTKQDFGNIEHHTGWDRTIDWIPQENIKKIKLHKRLNDVKKILLEHK